MLAEKSPATERGEQKHAADDRRQHQREQDEPADQARPGKRTRGQYPRQRHAEQHR